MGSSLFTSAFALIKITASNVLTHYWPCTHSKHIFLHCMTLVFNSPGWVSAQSTAFYCGVHTSKCKSQASVRSSEARSQDLPGSSFQPAFQLKESGSGFLLCSWAWQLVARPRGEATSPISLTPGRHSCGIQTDLNKPFWNTDFDVMNHTALLPLILKLLFLKHNTAGYWWIIANSLPHTYLFFPTST